MAPFGLTTQAQPRGVERREPRSGTERSGSSLGLTRMFHKHRHSERVLFINTLLQRGGGGWWRGANRFSGFRRNVETVEIETVLHLCPAQNTPLKQGVNDKMRSDNHFVCEMFRLTALTLFGRNDFTNYLCTVLAEPKHRK